MFEIGFVARARRKDNDARVQAFVRRDLVEAIAQGVEIRRKVPHFEAVKEFGDDARHRGAVLERIA